MLLCQNCDFGKQRLSVAKLIILQMAANTSIQALEVSYNISMIIYSVNIIRKNSFWSKYTFSLQIFTLTSETSFARSATFTWISTSSGSGDTRSGVRRHLICSKHWLISLWTTLKNMSMLQSMHRAFDFAAAHKRIVCIEWSIEIQNKIIYTKLLRINSSRMFFTKTMQYRNLFNNWQLIWNGTMLVTIVWECCQIVQQLAPQSSSYGSAVLLKG